MKKFYEEPSVEITLVGTTEDILTGSDTDVDIDIGDLWG